MILPRLRRLRRLRWLVAGLWAAGLPFVGIGCLSQPRAVLPISESRALYQAHHTQGLYAPDTPAPTIHQTKYQPGVEIAPGQVGDSAPIPVANPALYSPMSGAPILQPKPLPVGLDAVFRLAEEQNPRIAQAREKVQESCLEADLKAREAHLPTITAGLTYYRHEGGIQDQDGTLVKSSTGALFPGVGISAGINLREAAFARLDGLRKRTESRAELVKINNEILLEAATTYVDLLAARRGEAVVRESERMQVEMLSRAEKLAEEEPLAKLAVEGARAEVIASQQMGVHLHQQGNAAAAKLAYLLGLGCDIQPVPIDPDLVPLQLVDISPPVEKLIAQVQHTGPGVQELHELLGTIQTGLTESESLKQYLPTVQLTAIEGPFAAGPGGTLGLSNRFDVALGVKWNLTEFLTAQDKRRVAKSKMAQLGHTTQDLKNKLALAVQEARDLILASRERFGLATNQVRSLAEFYRLGREAVLENLPAEKVKISDLLVAIRSLREAHLAHVQTVQNHNKAQVRLLLLLKQ